MSAKRARSIPAARRRASKKRQSSSLIEGTFAFRFDGFALFSDKEEPSVTLYLVGVGLMKLDGQGNISGKQSSTTTPIALTKPLPGFPLACEYRLEGKYSFSPDGTGQAQVTFIPQDKRANCAREEGTFSLIIAGPGKFWLNSVKLTVKGSTVDEVCQGEAVRILA